MHVRSKNLACRDTDRVTLRQTQNSGNSPSKELLVLLCLLGPQPPPNAWTFQLQNPYQVCGSKEQENKERSRPEPDSHGQSKNKLREVLIGFFVVAKNWKHPDVLQ